MISANIINLVIASVIAAAIGYSGYEVFAEFEKKHQRQGRAYNDLRSSRKQLDRVEIYGEQFVATFPDISESTDMYSLLQALQIESLTGSNPDDISLVSIDNIRANGQEIPLYEICLSNGSGGFDLKESSVDAAMQRMYAIDDRPDVQYKSVRIRNAPASSNILVSYDKLCVLGRVG